MANYKKRSDGRYMAQVTIGTLENGKPKKKTVYAKTIRELKEIIADIKRNYKQGTLVSDENITVEEWVTEWFETYKSSKEYKTQDMYRIIIKNHIVPELGMYKLKDLKTHHIQALINSRHEQGITRTLQIIKLTINQMLEQALRNDLIYKNVCVGVELPSIKQSPKRALTENEKHIILNAPLDLKAKTFVTLLLFTGLRKGEALALTKKDIDLIENSLNVCKDIVIKGNKAEIKNYPKSQAGNRTVPIPDDLKKLLICYLPTVTSKYIFPSARNELMSLSAFRKFWDKIVNCLNEYAGGNKDMKIISNDITPHIFRHTYSTMLYYAGIDIKAAQKLLGHNTIQMTMEVYTHLQENNIENTDKLNSFISKMNKDE